MTNASAKLHKNTKTNPVEITTIKALLRTEYAVSSRTRSRINWKTMQSLRVRSCTSANLGGIGARIRIDDDKKLLRIHIDLILHILAKQGLCDERGH